LMYVGATRAKESLHIIYPKKGGYELWQTKIYLRMHFLKTSR
jgi:superfamily I DNA/RNA helicase